MRGDHVSGMSRRTWPIGTPPRARGSLLVTLRRVEPGGNTPACAGITRTRAPIAAISWEHPRVRGDHIPTGVYVWPRFGTPPRARGSQDAPSTAGNRDGNTPACAGITSAPACILTFMEEHPRVRGDHPMNLWSCTGPRGTPPRARGSRGSRRARQRRRRNTPACAGITGGRPGAGWLPPEHPRVRGDHLSESPNLSACPGTPPRARGSPFGDRDHRHILGNTPACAGITVEHEVSSPYAREHPRVRGDHKAPGPAFALTKGTPPRARGSPAHRVRRRRRRGNTPACAGITAEVTPNRPLPTEHPRVRGDHFVQVDAGASDDGTPPRARGSLLVVRRRGWVLGNTPACAGITGAPSVPMPCRREHPRVRGDHQQPVAGAAVVAGTPPRARGSRLGRDRTHRARGNTPACAGITRRARGRSQRAWEHPRVRGDHVSRPAPIPITTGTPPRARGSRGGGLRLPPDGGNTPACAGITARAARTTAHTAEHPRVRGDHIAAVTIPDMTIGTPPRARGSRSARRATGQRPRNTPACAGITLPQ